MILSSVALFSNRLSITFNTMSTFPFIIQPFLTSHNHEQHRPSATAGSGFELSHWMVSVDSRPHTQMWRMLRSQWVPSNYHQGSNESFWLEGKQIEEDDNLRKSSTAATCPILLATSIYSFI
jgi:hypothetical protein